MYGEPSFYEYAEMMAEANAKISTNGFKCLHNNTGWLGYYITTPKGKGYQLVRNNPFSNEGYHLCEHTPELGKTGRSLGLEFKDLEECKQYLLDNE